MSQNVHKAMSQQRALPSEDAAAEDDLTASLMLDDVFFLLKKCVQRAVAGHNVDGVCAVLNNACGILEQDFCGMLHGQVRRSQFPSRQPTSLKGTIIREV